MTTDNTKPYSNAIIKLLKGTIENDDAVWQDIVVYQSEIQNFVSVIGLELIIEKEDGYAFLQQTKSDGDSLISLVSRRRLPFEVSVVLIVIRQILEEFDSNPLESQSNDKYVSVSDIKDEMELFLSSYIIQFIYFILKSCRRVSKEILSFGNHLVMRLHEC